MFRRSVVLAVAAVAGRALGQSVPNCDLLGPAYPVPTSLATSPFIIGAANASLAAINTGLTTGRTEFGPIESNVSSFSVAVFSIHDTDSQYLFEHHYLAPAHRNLTTGSRLDGETLYRIGSITKLLTVYTILAKLGDEYWDRHITDFVPQLLASSSGDSSKSVQWEEVTLGDLASHLAGVGRDGEHALLHMVESTGLTATSRLWRPVRYPRFRAADRPPCSQRL